MQPVARLLLFVAATGAGCSPASGPADAGDGGGATDGSICSGVGRPDAGDFPPDVFAVLSSKCHPCHGSPPVNGAKFPLLTWEDTQKQFGITDHARWQRMAEVIEPGGLPHMPYQSAPQLTDAQMQTLRRWFSACALPTGEGQGCDRLSDGGFESLQCDGGP